MVFMDISTLIGGGGDGGEKRWVREEGPKLIPEVKSLVNSNRTKLNQAKNSLKFYFHIGLTTSMSQATLLA